MTRSLNQTICERAVASGFLIRTPGVKAKTQTKLNIVPQSFVHQWVVMFRHSQKHLIRFPNLNIPTPPRAHLRQSASICG